MHALSVDQRGRAIGRQLRRRAVGREEEEVVVTHGDSVLSTWSELKGLLRAPDTLEGSYLLLRLGVDEVVLLAEGDREELALYDREGSEVLSPRTLRCLPDDSEELVLREQGLLGVCCRRRAEDKARAVDIHIVATEPAQGAERGTAQSLGRAEGVLFEGRTTMLLLCRKVSHREGGGSHSK